MIQQPSRDLSLIKPNGIAQDQFQGWIDSVTNLLNSLEIIRGSASPEGVVYADIGKIYFDTAGAPGAFFYTKTTEKTLNTGWLAYA